MRHVLGGQCLLCFGAAFGWGCGLVLGSRAFVGFAIGSSPKAPGIADSFEMGVGVEEARISSGQCQFVFAWNPVEVILKLAVSSDNKNTEIATSQLRASSGFPKSTDLA